MPDPNERYHEYHAEAAIFEGELKLPFAQKIGSHTYSKLNKQGGYVTQHSENVRLGGAISFKSAYTHVAGNRSDKADHGWNTLATSVIEGLNIMEIVTVDRIVAQISTDHPPVGYVPTVTFLGTRFENLRIAGKPLDVDINCNILGPKPDKDGPYSTHAHAIKNVTDQYQRIQGCKNLPAEIGKRYNQTPSAKNDSESIDCSLVNQVSGSFPGTAYGHVLDIPDFGKVYLATVSVRHSDYKKGVPHVTTIHLKMLELKMGCVVSGDGTAGGLITNGHTRP
jgi:hypothetical protein